MHSVNPDPVRVAQAIGDLALGSPAPLSAYWLAVVGDRDEYAAQLAPLLGKQGTAVLIVRKERFDNPNSLMVDLVHILEENRAVFLAALREDRLKSDRISIVLLARTEFAMGQGYSPVTWPEWVPGVGGQQVSCFITDITRRIYVPLDAPEVDIGRIHRALYAVDSALVRRLVHISMQAPQAQTGLFTAIRRRTDVSWLEFLARVKSSLENVANTESYRPSARRGDSVISRLWEVEQVRSAAEVENAARGLAAALQISDTTPLEGWREGLFGVLARGLDERKSLADRFCRNAILTTSMACQYVTCKAHAADYQEFPINLLTSVMDDLHQSLVSIEVTLIHLRN